MNGKELLIKAPFVFSGELDGTFDFLSAANLEAKLDGLADGGSFG